jgi:hypothetical protein
MYVVCELILPPLNSVADPIRIWIHMFLCLLDPDPSVRGMDPDPDLDPSIAKQEK